MVLGYRCTRRYVCETAYGINRSTNTFLNFTTRSRSFRTSRGTRVGHSRRGAQRREGRKVHGGCFGYTITKASGERFLSLVVNSRWVTDLSSRGPGGGPYFSC